MLDLTADAAILVDHGDVLRGALDNLRARLRRLVSRRVWTGATWYWDLNPEELFVTALASCQLLTYLALAPRAGVTVLAYEDHPQGTLAIAERRMRMTEVLLRPAITVAAGTDEVKARALVETAHDGCFIANSVTCAVRVEATVTVDGS